jgi:hypothetical protein
MTQIAGGAPDLLVGFAGSIPRKNSLFPRLNKITPVLATLTCYLLLLKDPLHLPLNLYFDLNFGVDHCNLLRVIAI